MHEKYFTAVHLMPVNIGHITFSINPRRLSQYLNQTTSEQQLTETPVAASHDSIKKLTASR